MKTPNIADLLKTQIFDSLIHISYRDSKRYLHDDFQDLDDDLMVSHAKAFIVMVYNSLDNDEKKEEFINDIQDRLRGPAIIRVLIRDFIGNVNSLKSKIGDPINKDIFETIKELEKYKDIEVYKELSKGNNEIAKIIKYAQGYLTIKELKKHCHDESTTENYVISEEEIRILEITKNYPHSNQLAHLLFDEVRNYDYYCDHEINGEKDALKQLLINTNKQNPKFDIVFDDGTIACYHEGYIRIRPYNFKHIVRYTKLYFAKNFDKLMALANDPMNAIIFDLDLDSPEKKGTYIIVQSALYVKALLSGYESVYTKKMIEDSKKRLEEVKELTKKHDF